MPLTKIWNGLHLFTQQKRALHDIYAVEELRRILQRERARTDRTGNSFSLVVFDIGNTRVDENATVRLTQVLTQRVRSIDEIGWFDRQHISVVLPATPAQGASKLAEDICKAMVRHALTPKFKVYTYPTWWSAHDRAHSRDSGDPDNYSNRRTATQNDITLDKIVDARKSTANPQPSHLARRQVWARSKD